MILIPQYAISEGEVSVRIQHPDGVKARSVRPSSAARGGYAICITGRLLTDRLEAGSAPLTLWQAATADTLPDDLLLPACRWSDEWTAAGP